MLVMVISLGEVDRKGSNCSTIKPSYTSWFFLSRMTAFHRSFFPLKRRALAYRGCRKSLLLKTHCYHLFPSVENPLLSSVPFCWDPRAIICSLLLRTHSYHLFSSVENPLLSSVPFCWELTAITCSLLLRTQSYHLFPSVEIPKLSSVTMSFTCLSTSTMTRLFLQAFKILAWFSAKKRKEKKKTSCVLSGCTVYISKIDQIDESSLSWERIFSCMNTTGLCVCVCVCGRGGGSARKGRG